MPTLLDLVRRETANLCNEYVANAPDRWETIYAHGFGEMLDRPEQRARHYVVAGLCADLAPRTPSVLDVGSGFGTTCALLRRVGARYAGVDVSARAVDACRARFDGDPDATFEVADFERYDPGRAFDVVILNEVLQYFPLRRHRAVVEKAVSHLAGPRGLLVVSLCSFGKSSFLSRVASSLPRPAQRISVRSRRFTLFGGRWVVSAYTGLAA